MKHDKKMAAGRNIGVNEAGHSNISYLHLGTNSNTFVPARAANKYLQGCGWRKPCSASVAL